MRGWRAEDGGSAFGESSCSMLLDCGMPFMSRLGSSRDKVRLRSGAEAAATRAAALERRRACTWAVACCWWDSGVENAGTAAFAGFEQRRDGGREEVGTAVSG